MNLYRTVTFTAELTQETKVITARVVVKLLFFFSLYQRGKQQHTSPIIFLHSVKLS